MNLINYLKLYGKVDFKTYIFLLINRIVEKTLFIPGIKYYSQTGEDAIIHFIFRFQKKGFYVDVGCNDPIRMSNTFYFYLQGWSGICIDANEKLIKKHRKVRPRDIAIHSAVSNVSSEVVFYEFDSDLVSTLDEAHKEEWSKHNKVINAQKIKTKKLSEILASHLPQGQQIDVLSVDVEGHDLEVLKSADLMRYKPRIILVEIHEDSVDSIVGGKIFEYLSGENYRLKFFATMNAYFERME